ncbi:MAG TPA: CRISPR-associated primase-polymerase type A1, partial [Candidatus Ozemobacteraceae bacterium]|nr:CRISPR-associated primase-polymerase type A1 [Candidatus Ozemobacteraceae bacterium]
MTNTHELVHTARRLQGSGRAAEALAVLEQAVREGATQPSLLALRARLLSQLESPEEGRKQLVELVQAHPDDAELFLDLLSLHLDAGEADEVQRLATQGLESFPRHPGITAALIDALDLLNQPAAAEETARQALEAHPHHPDLERRLRQLTEAANRQKRLQETVHEAGRAAQHLQRRIPTDPAFLADFLDVFSGREGVHALQFQTKGGDWGYRPVHTTLTEEKLKRHLAGDETLGLYLVRHDNTSRVMVFDLDITKPFIARFLRDPLERRRLNALLEQEGRRLLFQAKEIGLPLLCEHSGFKGLHFWAIAEAPIPARQWRAVGQWLLDKLDRLPRELAWELFPKQDTVPEDGLGNLVKIPLGIHRKTSNRSWFLDAETLKAADDQQAAYFDYQRLSPQTFSDILGRLTLTHLIDETRRENADRSAEQASHASAPTFGSADGRPAGDSALSSRPPLSGPPCELAIRIPLPPRFPERIEQVLAGCRVTWALVEQVLAQR